MQDIRDQDRRLFISEILRFDRIIATAFFAGCVGWAMYGIFGGLWMSIGLLPVILHVNSAWHRSVRKRFTHKRFEALWNSVKDRLTRFEEVLGRLRKDQIADLQEMPKTIRAVSHSLYAALRRADIITVEVLETEKGILHQPPTWTPQGNDPQLTELYRIADKNIAEYRQRYAGVMAGVQRAEAQCAVFMTTLDTLRMQLIGHRLAARSPEMSSQDFLEAMSEAKLQLQAIDRALEELDFRQFPTMIAMMPPPIPEELQQEQR